MRKNRSGFTLIELMITISILAILIAVLLPAINSVRSTVSVSSVRTEISQLEAAIAEFKSEYGVSPPSRIHLYENKSGWDADPSERSKIRGVWGKFDFSQDRDFNGDGDSSDFFILKGDQAMVFFLGGSFDSVSGFHGFSSNPLRPFGFRTDSSGTLIREYSSYSVGPFFRFDHDRVRTAVGATYPFYDNGTLTGDCVAWFPVYVDTIQGQVAPYIYSSSYDSSGYHDSYPDLSSDANTSLSVAEVTNGFRAYRRNPSLMWNEKSFQIVSPGFDGKYGEGGVYVSGGSSKFPVSPSGTQRISEEDNVTNFTRGMLGWR